MPIRHRFNSLPLSDSIGIRKVEQEGLGKLGNLSHCCELSYIFLTIRPTNPTEPEKSALLELHRPLP